MLNDVYYSSGFSSWEFIGRESDKLCSCQVSSTLWTTMNLALGLWVFYLYYHQSSFKKLFEESLLVSNIIISSTKSWWYSRPAHISMYKFWKMKKKLRRRVRLGPPFSTVYLEFSTLSLTLRASPVGWLNGSLSFFSLSDKKLTQVGFLNGLLRL